MLFIISSPIGNLDDLSLRQAKTLLSSDIVLAEDTRSAKILLDAAIARFPQLAISNQQLVISYYKEKEFEKLPEIIDWLNEGKNIALVSESGTPLISDPGFLLVKTVIKKGLPFTVIPGPSAVTTSLIYSGGNPQEFSFFGFFPKKESEKIKLLSKLRSMRDVFPEMSFIFYESPNRINETLQCFKTLKWEPNIIICREMTKKFEEILRGKPDDLIEHKFKGEITLLIK